MFGGSLDHRCGQDNEGIVSCVNYGFFVALLAEGLNVYVVGVHGRGLT